MKSGWSPRRRYPDIADTSGSVKSFGALSSSVFSAIGTNINLLANVQKFKSQFMQAQTICIDVLGCTNILIPSFHVD